MTRERIMDLFMEFLNENGISQECYLSLIKSKEDGNDASLKETLMCQHNKYYRKDFIKEPIRIARHDITFSRNFMHSLGCEWVKFFNKKTMCDKMELIRLFTRFLHEKKMRNKYYTFILGGRKRSSKFDVKWDVVSFLEKCTINASVNTFMIHQGLYDNSNVPMRILYEARKVEDAWIEFAENNGCDIFWK